MASTKSSRSPIAALAPPHAIADPRSGSLPIFILTKRQPSRSTQPRKLIAQFVVAYSGEPAAAIDRHRVAAARRAGRERQIEERALRSHSAASTAEIAHRREAVAAEIADRCAALRASGRRISKRIAARRPSSASTPIRRRSRRRHKCSRCRPLSPPRPATTTRVVASQANVPSASGLSVGIAIGARAAALLDRRAPPPLAPVTCRATCAAKSCFALSLRMLPCSGSPLRASRRSSWPPRA